MCPIKLKCGNATNWIELNSIGLDWIWLVSRTYTSTKRESARTRAAQKFSHINGPILNAKSSFIHLHSSMIGGLRARSHFNYCPLWKFQVDSTHLHCACECVWAGGRTGGWTNVYVHICRSSSSITYLSLLIYLLYLNELFPVFVFVCADVCMCFDFSFGVVVAVIVDFDVKRTTQAHAPHFTFYISFLRHVCSFFHCRHNVCSFCPFVIYNRWLWPSTK